MTYKKKLTAFLCLTAAMLLPVSGRADETTETKEKSKYIPVFNGTARVRYEYFTQENKGAFKVRDLRFGVDGYVAPIMSYSAEVNFSDWGKIALVNGFIKLTPVKDLNFMIGQQRIPFTLSAHRFPWEQYFVNRTFTAKYGGIRDIGLVGSYAIPNIPLTVQASLFNCSGAGVEHRTYFTNTYGFSGRLISTLHKNWFLQASTVHQKKGAIWNQNWDIGAYFQNDLWHVEAEYLRKNYRHHSFDPVNSFDVFVYRNFPIEKHNVGGISGAVRYDYITDYTNGVANEEGNLTVDFPECHRLTLGATLTLQTKLQAYIRLNYEKYFYKNGLPAYDGEPHGDRVVLEVVAHF